MVTVEEIMTKNVITIGPQEPISKAISKMSDNKIHHLPVVEDDKYLGMVDFDIFLRRSSIVLNSKVMNVMEKTPTVAKKTDITETARLMLDNGIKAIPVLENESLQGIVTTSDIIYSLLKMPDILNSTVDEIMSGDPITVNEDDLVIRAVEKMRDLDEASIPVLDSNGRVTGVVNLDEISKQIWREKEKMHQSEYFRNEASVRVKDVMSPPVIAKSGSKLMVCVNEMKKMKARVCTVIDDSEKPLGIISHRDIMDEIVKGLPRESVLVNLSGVKFDDPEIYNRIYDIIERTAKNIAKVKRMKPMLINIHIEQYNEQGGEIKYSVRGKIVTESKTFYGRAWEWNLYKAMKELMDEFEKMVEKAKEMR